MSIKISVLERQFVNNYLINGGNGTQAYIKASPGVTLKSARERFSKRNFI